MNIDLIRKYNVPGPRYTSYPTVPYWDNDPTINDWKDLVKESFSISNQKEGISLYIHIPFCESLCTFCGCNTRITVNHGVEVPYMERLLKEWVLYTDLFEEKPVIKELHIGGGTPTFFSPENLKTLLSTILEKSEIHPNHAFSFEAHPKNSSKEHLQTLFDLGFKRLSLGIQDFDPTVQEVINRIQPYDMVKEVVENAKAIGYTSINFDLIYGLPFQKMSSVKDTIEKVNTFLPERIAFYSYAHVPWIKPSQRKYTEKDLPSDEEKRALYELGKQMFEDLGYVEIGMDHFALKTDDLSIAVDEKRLHRNFMGYSADHTTLMVGIGASSIGDSWTGFAQNIKKVEEYFEAVDNGIFPIYRGHKLSKEDLILRKHILNLMCHFETSWSDTETIPEFHLIMSKLKQIAEDGILEITETGLKVPEHGKPFVRNICMCFDLRLHRKQPDKALFSQTV